MGSLLDLTWKHGNPQVYFSASFVGHVGLLWFSWLQRWCWQWRTGSCNRGLKCLRSSICIDIFIWRTAESWNERTNFGHNGHSSQIKYQKVSLIGWFKSSHIYFSRTFSTLTGWPRCRNIVWCFRCVIPFIKVLNIRWSTWCQHY